MVWLKEYTPEVRDGLTKNILDCEVFTNAEVSTGYLLFPLSPEKGTSCSECSEFIPLFYALNCKTFGLKYLLSLLQFLFFFTLVCWLQFLVANDFS